MTDLLTFMQQVPFYALLEQSQQERFAPHFGGGIYFHEIVSGAGWARLWSGSPPPLGLSQHIFPCWGEGLPFSLSVRGGGVRQLRQHRWAPTLGAGHVGAPARCRRCRIACMTVSTILCPGIE